MKYIILLIMLCWGLDVQGGTGKKLKYIDAEELTIVNKTQPVGPKLQRLDVERYPQLSKKLKEYFSYSTGLAVAFKTNSTNIHVKWKTTEEATSVNTTLITQSGMDLYIRRDNEWVFAGIATPTWKNQHHSPVVENMDNLEKECLLYLPLFNCLDSLQIGVDEDAELVAFPDVFHRKVVVIGSSITHGASASRPGTAYPARLNRALNVEFTNLGACGLCRMEDFYAKIAGDTRADAFLFDTFSNPSPTQIEERLPVFIARIRDKHPETPLIFLQTEIRETGNFDLKKRDYEYRKRTSAEEGMKKIKDAGYENVYFINPGIVLGKDHEATTDGVHPSDAGFDRMVNALLPQLNKILQKHGITY